MVNYNRFCFVFFVIRSIIIVERSTFLRALILGLNQHEEYFILLTFGLLIDIYSYLVRLDSFYLVLSGSNLIVRSELLKNYEVHHKLYGLIKAINLTVI